MDFDLTKTRNLGSLSLKKSKRVIWFSNFGLAVVRGIPMIFIQLPLIKSPLLSDLPFTILITGYFFNTWFVGHFLLKLDLKLKSIKTDNVEFTKRSFRKYLEFNGWNVANDSRDYFYAYKYNGTPNRVDHFFMMYENGYIRACSVYALPFPFSLFSGRRDLSMLAKVYNSVSNKKRNEVDGSVEPPIR